MFAIEKEKGNGRSLREGEATALRLLLRPRVGIFFKLFIFQTGATNHSRQCQLLSLKIIILKVPSSTQETTMTTTRERLIKFLSYCLADQLVDL